MKKYHLLIQIKDDNWNVRMSFISRITISFLFDIQEKQIVNDKQTENVNAHVNFIWTFRVELVK